MTSRERLVTAMLGGTPDRVPVSPFHFGLVDPDSPMGHEMLRRLDMIISPGFEGGSPFFGVGAPIEGTQEGSDNVTLYHTPKGDLRSVFRRTSIQHAQVEYPCKTPDDIEKLLSMPFEPPRPTAEAYRQWVERAGEEALVMVGLGDAICIPATVMSPEDMCLCWADAPDLLLKLTNVAHSRLMPVIEELCRQGVKAFRIVGGEYASTQLGPRGFAALVLEQDRELCDLMRRYGAISYYHNHGVVMQYLELFRAVGMDAIDPFEHPPFGDADLRVCREKLGKICIVGNLDDMEQIEQLPHDRLKELAAERLAATGSTARVLGGTASGTYTEKGAAGFLALLEVAEAFRG
ncbi:MAG: hypothetical protein HYU66_20615 [Armatimonadetes bacterium]|nr:hypothetical protein [Armatimonadota bacterium]